MNSISEFLDQRANAIAPSGEPAFAIKLIDKSSWSEGEWSDEPDLMAWLDQKTGYACLCLRNQDFGHLNGYIGVPLDSISTSNFQQKLPGILNFSEPAISLPDSLNELDSALNNGTRWWIGFDTMHASDARPWIDHDFQGIPEDTMKFLKKMVTNDVPGATYKNMTYIHTLCSRYALQIFNDLHK
jgi:hypothetical protein